MHAPAGDPAAFHTTWAASGGIDGCIDHDAALPKCMAVLLSDQADGRGYFALLTAQADRGNYLFSRPGKAPINLAAIPRPETEGVPSAVAGGIQVAVRVGRPTAGAYLDPTCPPGVIAGYKIYYNKVPRNSAPPGDRERSDARGWRLANGGETAGGLALALNTAKAVGVDCSAAEDVYLAASLVFDSGFELAHLSENSTPVRAVHESEGDTDA